MISFNRDHIKHFLKPIIFQLKEKNQNKYYIGEQNTVIDIYQTNKIKYNKQGYLDTEDLMQFPAQDPIELYPYIRLRSI